MPNSIGSCLATPISLFVTPSSPPVSLFIASIETSTWYPDSSATSHVCHRASMLRDSREYSGKTPLLMGDGTCAPIAHLGHSVTSTSSKLLHLTNVLHVPIIHKNLLLISQFSRDNNVFFEFYPFHCLVKDIQTKEVMLRGHTYEGLY